MLFHPISKGSAMLRPSLSALAALTLLSTQVRAQQYMLADQRPISAVIADLKAAAPQTRNAAAYTLSGMGPDAAPAVPALIEALNDEAATVRFPVCVALREIGPAASAALPALEKALDDPNDDVAAMAQKAIDKIKGTEGSN